MAVEHTFYFDTNGWHEQPQSVHLSGTFNGWDKTAVPMVRGDDGVYTASLDLDLGVYQYKFVLNGKDWVADPIHSDKTIEESDAHGGMNSAVLIGPDARKLSAPKPNHVRDEALSHNPGDFTHRNVVSQNLLLLGVSTQANDVEKVFARVLDDKGEVQQYELARERSELGIDRWIGLIETTPGTTSYNFVLHDGTDVKFLTPTNDAAPQGDHPHSLDYFTVEMKIVFRTPDWAKHAVWYQIFPERFRNGDPANDPGDAGHETKLPWTIDWWKTYPKHGEVSGEENFYAGHGNVWRRRFGGDLQGVRQALPYLRELGVNALYLNPVFEADSMHKYDTSDFRHIDDNFGVKSRSPHQQIEGETDDPETWGWSESDKVFLEFIEQAHAQGFKVVIDGVFNHVGKNTCLF